MSLEEELADYARLFLDSSAMMEFPDDVDPKSPGALEHYPTTALSSYGDGVKLSAVSRPPSPINETVLPLRHGDSSPVMFETLTTHDFGPMMDSALRQEHFMPTPPMPISLVPHASMFGMPTDPMMQIKPTI